MKNNTLSYRVDQLENKVDGLDNKIDRLLTNDIPHLSASIVELKTRINVMTAFNIGAIILGIVISKMIL